MSTTNARFAKIRSWISGVLGAQLDPDEDGEQDQAGDDRSPGAPGLSQPQVARLLQAEHEQAHAERDQDGAAVVERRRALDVVGLRP